MRPTAVSCIVGVVVLVLSTQVNAQNLKGEWLLKECTIGGEKHSGKKIDGMKLEMGYTDFTATAGGRESSGTMEVARGNRDTPSKLTMKIEKGEDAGRVLKAIFKREGADLVVAFSRSQDFPTDYESTASNQYAVMKYSYIKRNTVLSADDRRKRRDPSVITGMGGGRGARDKK